MRSQLEGADVSNCLMMEGNRFGAVAYTLAATFAIPANSPSVLFLDPGGAGRNVTLPASPKLGQWYRIYNTADAAEVLTIQDSAGGALTPAITPTQSEMAFVIWNGSAWRGHVAIGV